MGPEGGRVKILVTGGGGFLGGSIVRQLVDRGYEVKSFSRGTYHTLEDLGVEQCRGDLSDLNAVKKAVKDCDAVIHVAAKAGMWGAEKDYFMTNVLGTSHVIHACEYHGVKRLIYTSSPSVVFSGKDMENANESESYAERFVAPYPESKAIGEKMVLAANGDTLATMALRPHLIFGPGDPHLVPRLVAKARSKRLMFLGNGLNKVDVVFVDNAALAHIKALEKLEPGSPVSGKAYFISNNEPKTIEDIFNNITTVYGAPAVKRKIPKSLAYGAGWLFEKFYVFFGIEREPLVTRFIAKELSTSHWFDISAARKDFGYEPEITFEEGLSRMEAHYHKTGSF